MCKEGEEEEIPISRGLLCTTDGVLALRGVFDGWCLRGDGLRGRASRVLVRRGHDSTSNSLLLRRLLQGLGLPLTQFVQFIQPLPNLLALALEKAEEGPRVLLLAPQTRLVQRFHGGLQREGGGQGKGGGGGGGGRGGGSGGGCRDGDWGGGGRRGGHDDHCDCGC